MEEGGRVNEPEMSLIAEIDQAVHDNEHTDRPDWCLDGAVPPTVMSTEHGSLAVHHDSCRYCLTDQAAAIGLGAALTAYLTTPVPPPPPRPTPEQLEARRRADAEREATMHDAYLTIEEYEAMGATERAVYDLIDRECGGHHANRPGLIDDLVAAVRLADQESNRGAMAPEQPGEFAPLIPDTPLFTIEGEAPNA